MVINVIKMKLQELICHWATNSITQNGLKAYTKKKSTSCPQFVILTPINLSKLNLKFSQHFLK